MHQAQYWGENPYIHGNDTGIRLLLPYKQIEKIVEPLDVPDTIVYVLKDMDTGEYFKGFIDDYQNNEHHLQMSKTFSGAKKYATIGNAKSSILSWSGMLVDKGIEGVSTDMKMGLPRQWRLVPIDPISKIEGVPIDLEDWYVEKSVFFKLGM